MKYMIHTGMTAILVIVVPLLSMPVQADTEGMNGNRLLETCRVAVSYLENGDSVQNLQSVRDCDDYLTGFREAENIKQIYMPGYYSTGYCLPRSGVSNGDAARAVVSYLENHRQELNQPATELVREALAEGYPCAN